MINFRKVFVLVVLCMSSSAAMAGPISCVDQLLSQLRSFPGQSSQPDYILMQTAIVACQGGNSASRASTCLRHLTRAQGGPFVSEWASAAAACRGGSDGPTAEACVRIFRDGKTPSWILPFAALACGGRNTGDRAKACFDELTQLSPIVDIRFHGNTNLIQTLPKDADRDLAARYEIAATACAGRSTAASASDCIKKVGAHIIERANDEQKERLQYPAFLHRFSAIACSGQGAPYMANKCIDGLIDQSGISGMEGKAAANICSFGNTPQLAISCTKQVMKEIDEKKRNSHSFDSSIGGGLSPHIVVSQYCSGQLLAQVSEINQTTIDGTKAPSLSEQKKAANQDRSKHNTDDFTQAAKPEPPARNAAGAPK